MEEILGRIEERQRDHDRRKSEHQRQHHLGEDEDDAGHEAKEAQEHEADAAEDRARHPVQVVTDGIQVLAELRDEIIELGGKVRGPCPAATDRGDQGPGDIVEPADNGIGDRVEVGPVEGKRPISVSLIRYQKKLAPSMLRNWKAMLMQTPISESVTISRTIVPVLLPQPRTGTLPHRQGSRRPFRPSS